jgi:hypothetical protein
MSSSPHPAPDADREAIDAVIDRLLDPNRNHIGWGDREFIAAALRATPAQHSGAADDHTAAKASLLVLSAIRDAQSWHENMLKDIDYAIEANRAALATLPPSMGGERGDEWQGISNAPKDGTNVLGFIPDFRCPIQTIDFSARYGNWWAKGEECAPTHWMPLPTEPGATPMPVERGQETLAVRANRLFGNCDGWGALEWFNRLADAVMERDKAVVSGDDIQFDIYNNIASSSASELVRGFRTQIREALAPTESVIEAAAQLLDKRAAECSELSQRVDLMEETRVGCCAIAAELSQQATAIRALAAPQSSQNQIHESPLANVRSPIDRAGEKGE